MMATRTPKTKAAAPAESPKSRTLQVADDGLSQDKRTARQVFDPTINTTITSMEYSKGMFSDLSLTDCVDAMRGQVKAVNDGNLSNMEAVLVAQAKALDAMFNSLARRAISNMGGGHMQAADTYMRLALKAQGQCRATIETIGELKYPKSATFIRQANIAGQQQVNNGGPGFETGTRADTREEKVIPTNELLSEGQHASLDTGRKAAAGRPDSAMATLAPVDRAED
jgi:hypothetical protein